MKWFVHMAVGVISLLFASFFVGVVVWAYKSQLWLQVITFAFNWSKKKPKPLALEISWAKWACPTKKKMHWTIYYVVPSKDRLLQVLFMMLTWIFKMAHSESNDKSPKVHCPIVYTYFWSFISLNWLLISHKLFFKKKREGVAAKVNFAFFATKVECRAF